MSTTKHSDTIVIQTFRTHNIPHWIQRCLDSVANWAKLHGHNYSLYGDEFYDFCGPEYLGRGSKNPQAITNLARLVATRHRLDAGYQRVIWMDADVFVFDPTRLVLNFSTEQLVTGYAFGREVWLSRRSGSLAVSPARAHNAAMYFTREAVDLDMLITLIRHIDSKREIVSNYQLGVRVLQGLQYSLMFPTFSHVGVFSPVLVLALAKRDEMTLRFFAQTCRYQVHAANLCSSLQYRIGDDLLWLAMDCLEAGNGEAINKYATEKIAYLAPYDDTAAPWQYLYFDTESKRQGPQSNTDLRDILRSLE